MLKYAIISIIMYIPTDLSAGPVEEYFISEHGDWRAYKNYHVESDGYSCLIATFDGRSSLTALTDSDRYVHFMVKIDVAEPVVGVNLVLESGASYHASDQLVAFSSYEDRVAFIDALFSGYGQQILARKTINDEALAKFSLSGAGMALSTLFECINEISN